MDINNGKSDRLIECVDEFLSKHSSVIERRFWISIMAAKDALERESKKNIRMVRKCNLCGKVFSTIDQRKHMCSKRCGLIQAKRNQRARDKQNNRKDEKDGFKN